MTENNCFLLQKRKATDLGKDIEYNTGKYKYEEAEMFNNADKLKKEEIIINKDNLDLDVKVTIKPFDATLPKINNKAEINLTNTYTNNKLNISNPFDNYNKTTNTINNPFIKTNNNTISNPFMTDKNNQTNSSFFQNNKITNNTISNPFLQTNNNTSIFNQAVNPNWNKDEDEEDINEDNNDNLEEEVSIDKKDINEIKDSNGVILVPLIIPKNMKTIFKYSFLCILQLLNEFFCLENGWRKKW